MAVADVYIEGYISSYDWSDTVSAKSVRERIAAFDTTEDPLTGVNVWINCGGGEVAEALLIHDMLRQQTVPVKVIIAGICYSAATIIAQGSDTRLMYEHAEWMMHPVSGYAEGTEEEVRAYADILAKYGKVLIDMHVKGSNLDEATITTMIAETTYLNSEQCIEMGFATGLFSVENHRKETRAAVNFMQRKIKNLQTKNRPVMAKATPKKKEQPKPLNAFQRLKKAINEALNDTPEGEEEGGSEVTNLVVALSDDTSLYVDAAGTVPAVGDIAYVDEEQTETAEDGDYELKDGTGNITVSGGAGKISAVPSTEENNNDNSEAINALTARLDSLELDYKTLKAENAKNVKALNAANAALGKKGSPELEQPEKSKAKPINKGRKDDSESDVVERRRARMEAQNKK